MSQDEQEAREWLDAQEVRDRSDDKTWYGIGATELSALFAAYAQVEHQRGYEAGLEAAAQVADFARLSNVAAAIRALPRKG